MQRNRGKQQIGKTRDLFKKIRDDKEHFIIKDRNGMNLIEAEDMARRGGKNT